MSYQLNRKLAELIPYEPLQGEYRVRLDANESFLPVDKRVLNDVAEALGSCRLNRYPDPYCSELCKRFSDYYGVDPANVTVGNGSDELISIIVNCFSLKGEKVLCFTPDFSMYSFYGYLAECEVQELKKDESMQINVDEAIRVVNEQGISMVLFSNPCNPASVGLCREDVIRLVSSVSALVVLDEAYMDFWNQSLLEQANDFDNLILLKTCSKALGMAGVRLGFAVANPTVTRALRAAKSPYNVNCISQLAGETLFSYPQLLRRNTEKIIESKELLLKKMLEFSKRYPTVLERVYPSCTNFVLIKTQKADEIYQKLLSASVAIRNFGNYLRISAGSPEENGCLFEALEGILKGETECGSVR